MNKKKIELKSMCCNDDMANGCQCLNCGADGREILGWDNKDKKNGNYGYRLSKCFPNEELRNKLVELGIPRWKHNLAELGELLPEDYSTVKQFGKYRCFKIINGNENGEFVAQISDDAKTEANARAKMLIYLIKNNLLNKL